MLRSALFALIVVVVAAPAFAVQWDVSGPCSGPISMSLTIPGYVQIIHQDCDIVWDSNYAGNLDYIRALAGGVVGQYDPLSAGDKPAMDAWAQAYYESFDGARIYLSTNTNLTMTVTPSGNLNDGSGHTLNTWYTLAAAPFVLGGVALNDGNIPADGPGSYAADIAAPAGFMELGGTPFWPNQYPFSMAGGAEVLSLPAPAHGTLKWLGRVQRNGMADVAGVYNATITVGFTAP